MIQNFIMCSIFIMSTGCAAMVDLTVGTAGGALGNMIDRRVEDALGNDAGLSDDKLDGKITKKLGRGEVMIKIKGTETAAPTSTGAGTNLSNATMVRVYNSGSTARLVTVQLADNTAIGTFTLAGGAVEYVDKNNTDEIFAAHAEILLTSVIIVG